MEDLKEMKSATSKHMKYQTEKEGYCCYEKVSVVWIEDETPRNISLSHSLIQGKTFNSLQFYESWEMGKKKSFYLSSVNFKSFSFK